EADDARLAAALPDEGCRLLQRARHRPPHRAVLARRVLVDLAGRDAARGEHEVEALLGERQRGGLADAAARAGDQRNPSAQRLRPCAGGRIDRGTARPDTGAAHVQDQTVKGTELAVKLALTPSGAAVDRFCVRHLGHSPVSWLFARSDRIAYNR